MDPRRLASLRALRLLDSPPEPAFDRLTEMVRRLVDAPAAVISLVDAERLFFKSSVGLPPAFASGSTAPIDTSYCPDALAQSDALVIDEQNNTVMLEDRRRLGEFEINAYLGAPLLTSDDVVVGTVSVLDDGSRTWSESDIEAVVGIAESVVTVVERFAALVDLQESRAQIEQANRQLSTLVEAAPCAIWAIDAADEISLWSHGAMEFFGISEVDACGRPAVEVLGEAIGPDNARGILAELTEQGRLVPTEQLARKARTPGLPVEIWGASVAGADTGAVMMGIDVALRRSAENERLDLESRMEQIRRMEALGRLSGVIAHDFNNLLTAIQGFVELARLRTDLDEVSEDLTQVEAAAESATSLTKQLLHFSRGRPRDASSVDVVGEAKGHSGLLRQMVGDERHLSITIADEPIFVRAESSAVGQVLVNLVVNARDATPIGGSIDVSVGWADEQQAGSARSGRNGLRGGVCAIEVRDTGSGISPEVQGRIFEPFFSTKSRDVGTGIGLSAIYTIVEDAGGDIEVSSAPGVGTTFLVLLPAMDSAQTRSANQNGAGSSERRIGTVLLVEDEVAVRDFVTQILRRAGFEVLVADGGDEALSVAAKDNGNLDLLLTDLSMPGMSGTAVAEALPHLPSVFMSGYFVRPEEVRNRPFLQKPFNSAELLAVVDQTLAEAPATRMVRR